MTEETALRILVLYEHELTACGIKAMLVKLLPDAVIDIFATGSKIEILLKKNAYNLYIVDIEPDDVSGFDAVKAITKQCPEAKILICTMRKEIWYVRELKQLAVSGVLFKSAGIDMFDRAVTEILKGRSFFCDRYRSLVNNYRNTGYSHLMYEKFTGNELSILSMICRGCTTREIAGKMAWAVKTVEYYRKRLFEKFGVSNVARLVAVAMKEGFIKKEEI